MRISATLDEKASKEFQEIKEHFGVKANRSVVDLLISREHDRIQSSKRHKVFLPNEIYDKAEKAAKALNLTIDEYVDSVTEQLLKNPLASVSEASLSVASENEGVKHGN